MKIEVRHWREQDAEAMHAAITASVEHLRPWMPWVAEEPRPVADRRALISRWNREWKAGGDELFAIWVDGEVGGGCGLHRRIGPGGLEIGYWVAEAHIGRGVATEASRLLCERAFAQPSIDRLEIHHAANNPRSGRVPAKLGFSHVEDRPRPPDFRLAPGEAEDFSVWRLTRGEWERRHGAPTRASAT